MSPNKRHLAMSVFTCVCTCRVTTLVHVHYGCATDMYIYPSHYPYQQWEYLGTLCVHTRVHMWTVHECSGLSNSTQCLLSAYSGWATNTSLTFINIYTSALKIMPTCQSTDMHVHVSLHLCISIQCLVHNNLSHFTQMWNGHVLTCLQPILLTTDL